MSDVLLIRISSEVLERLATRDDTGNRLHVEWTEPDAEGFSTAIISVDYTDNPFADARLELSDYRATFDLRWKADMRAIQRWQAAHPGNDLFWPDHADLVVWLMEQLDQLPTALRRLKEGSDGR